MCYSLLLGNADPNIALTGSSSSEASIKATLTGSHRLHSHEGEPKDYDTEHLIHLRVIVAEGKFITNQVQNSQVLQSPSTQIIKVSLSQWKQ